MNQIRMLDYYGKWLNIELGIYLNIEGGWTNA